MNWKGAEGLLASMKTAFFVWLFFSATTALLAHIYEKQKLELALIHFGNQLTAYLLAGAIISFSEPNQRCLLAGRHRFAIASPNSGPA
ncbi:DUF1761 domain-containing protein [Hyphobacterium sp. CCMP332]|uniref:DUF1761 domain-containing protein n=1 Tax=Hyphobacterium sp. CCMP332 TaxID=2749086 RepID=UPI002104B4AF|nr:DUF1761 domain-containing protein [Hyphobacterium sp. CCMP332]